MATPAMTLGFNEAKLNAFMERVVGDLSAAMHATVAVIGDKVARRPTG